jgi:hypothetical protein
MNRNFLAGTTLLAIAIAILTAYHRTHSAQHDGAPATGDALARHDSQPPGEQGEALIRAAARDLISGPTLSARLRYDIQLGDHEVHGSGQYWQQSTPNPMSRLEIQYLDDGQPQVVLQINDGRILCTVTPTEQDQPQIELVDLAELATARTDTSLTHWMAPGSLGSLMGQLAEQFQFAAPEKVMLGDVPAWKASGRWRTDRLRRLMEGQVDPALIEGPDWWRYLPPQLPHSVEITMGQLTSGTWFPHRIVLRQMTDSQHSRDAVVLEFYDVRVGETLPAELFETHWLARDADDRTEFYRNRVQQFTR